MNDNFAFDTSLETISLADAIIQIVNHFDTSRENAGEILTKEYFINAICIIAETPAGQKYKIDLDKETFYPKEQIKKYLREGKEPDGKFLLSLGAKRFFYTLEIEMQRRNIKAKLAFDPALIPSVSDLQTDVNEGEENKWYAECMDAIETAKLWQRKAEELQKELDKAKQEIAELKRAQTVNDTITPGSPAFQPRVWGLCAINVSLPRTSKQQNMNYRLRDYFAAIGIDPPANLESIAWAISKNQRGKTIENSEEWIRKLPNHAGSHP